MSDTTIRNPARAPVRTLVRERSALSQKRVSIDPPPAETRLPGPAFSPLYAQIRALLVEGLDSGEWKPGEPIPSELELAARFRVSQGTVRKAIDELAASNLLVRRQGKGTFVATHNEPTSLFRFLRLAPMEGEVEYPVSRLLESRRVRASGEAARLLELRNGESMVFLRRLLLFRDVPTVVDEISLPGAIFKGFSAQGFNDWTGSMYGYFESAFGVRMIRADERIRAIAADVATAKLLDVTPGTPLLCVDRVTFTYGDRPVEFRRGLYRTDSHFYSNALS